MNDATIARDAMPDVLYDAHPGNYRHWKLAFDGAIATLALGTDEEAGIRPGYRLKLNSYDLGVDIELHDALQRIRFEHPEVKCVVITSRPCRAAPRSATGSGRRATISGGRHWRCVPARRGFQPTSACRFRSCLLSLPRPRRLCPDSYLWKFTCSRGELHHQC